MSPPRNTGFTEETRRVGPLGSCYYAGWLAGGLQRLSGRVKSKNRGGSGRSRARSTLCWPGWSRGAAKPRAAFDRDPFGYPAGRGQLRPGLTRSLRDQCEHHPLDHLTGQAPRGGDPADLRVDTKAFPDPVQRPRRAEAPRVQHLDPPPRSPAPAGWMLRDSQ